MSPTAMHWRFKIVYKVILCRDWIESLFYIHVNLDFIIDIIEVLLGHILKYQSNPYIYIRQTATVDIFAFFCQFCCRI